MTNMLKYIILLFVFLVMPRGNAAHAQTTYRLDQAPRYSETTGYGYDLTASPGKADGSPFFFLRERAGRQLQSDRTPGTRESGRHDDRQGQNPGASSSTPCTREKVSSRNGRSS